MFYTTRSRHSKQNRKRNRPTRKRRLLLEAMEQRRLLTAVAVFDNGAFVDTGGYSYGSESDTIQASLTALGHTVTPFTGTSASSISTALAGKDVLVIPELETGDLAAALSPAAKAEIAGFVSGGGGLIISAVYDARDVNLLNQVFGFSLTDSGGVGPASITAAAAGTAFSGGPASLSSYSYTAGAFVSTLPAGGKSIYQYGGETVVGLIPYGAGEIAYLGWDWFNAAPSGSRDGGWLDVLDRAVTQVAAGSGKVYRTGIDPTFRSGPQSFSVYDPGSDTWTSLGTVTTSANLAVSGNGELYMLNDVTNTIQRYDAVSNTWANVRPGPPVQVTYGNLEVTNSGEFLVTQSPRDGGDATLLWHTVGGGWSSFSLPGQAGPIGDYEHSSGTFVVARDRSESVWKIDLPSFAITTYSVGASSTGETRRWGEIYDGDWYTEWGTNPIRMVDLSSPTNSFQNASSSSPGSFASAALNELTGEFYASAFASTSFLKWDSGTDTFSSLASALRRDDHNSMAFVPSRRFNTPPTAEAGGAYSVDEGGSVVLSGSGTDSGGSIAAYDWDLDGDGIFGETGAAAGRGDEVGTSPTFSAAGLDGASSVTVELRVTDNQGETDTDAATIRVKNVAPTITAASLNATSINEGQSVTVSGAFTDPALGLTTETFTGTATWSDGVTTPLTISGGTFNGTRTFADDNPTGTPSDAFAVSISISDGDGGTATSQQLNTSSTIFGFPASGDQITSTAFAPVVGAHQLDFSNANGVAHAHAGTVDVYIDVHDPDSNSWNQVFHQQVSVGNDLQFNGLIVNFPAQTVDQVRLRSNPHQLVTFHASGTTSVVGSSSLELIVNNVDPVIGNVSASSTSISEGQSVTVSGTFTDPALGVATETFTGTATWSDGASTPLTISGGTFSTTRTFADDDPTGTLSDTFTVDITVNDDDGGSDTATSPVITVNNVAPELQNLTVTPTIDENGVATLTGDIIDPGTEDTFTLTVDWGDGSPAETFTYLAGTTSFSETHQYLDDDPSATPADPYSLSLAFMDDDGGSAAIGGGAGSDVAILGAPAGGAAWLQDVEDKVEATGHFGAVDTFLVGGFGGGTPSLAQLQQYDSVLVFSDARFENPTLLGDTLADYVDAGGGVVVQTFAFNVSPLGGRWDTGGYSPIQIASQGQFSPLTLGAVHVAGHSVLDGVNSFHGGSSSYHNTGAINPNANVVAEWSNGRPLIVELPSFNADILALNFYPPSDDVRSDFWHSSTDGDLLMANALRYVGGASNAALEVTVNNVDPVIETVNAPVINENGTATISGAFSDVGTLDTHTVTIDWGDGTSSSATVDPVARTFSADHQYLDDSPSGTPSDVYDVVINIEDDDTGTDSVETTVTVTNVDPVIDTLNAPVINENGTATISGAFSDAGTLDTHTVMVDWGDGTSSPATVDPVARTFTADHQYLDDDPTGTGSDAYPIGVTIEDDDTGVDTATTTVTVNNVDPTLMLDPVAGIDENGIATLTGTVADPGSLDTHTVEVDWGDGSTTTVVSGLKSNYVVLTEQMSWQDAEAAAVALGGHLVAINSAEENALVADLVQKTFGFNAGVWIGINDQATEGNYVWSNGDPVTYTNWQVGEPNDGGGSQDFGWMNFQSQGKWDDHFAGVRNDVLGAVVEFDSPSFTLTHQYLDDNPSGTASDTYAISATVTDDDGGEVTESEDVLVTNVVPQITSITTHAEDCGNAHEDDPVTLDLSFTDVGSLDVHTVTIDWGDGNSESVTLPVGGRSLSIDHDYAVGGIYTVDVTVADDDSGADSTSRLAVVSGVGLHDGVLQIIGTTADDHVTLNQTGSGTLKVHADFIAEDVLGETRDFSLADVDRILMVLCDGDDHATISSRVDLDAIIDGGAGNDHLNGGNGSSLILGRDGDDHINGGSGKDVLVGGLGADRVVGNPGQDLIAGGVLQNASTGARDTIADEADLLAMQAKWSSASAADIDGWRDGTDDFFAGLALELDGDDGAVDKLTGSSAGDWFLTDSEDLVTGLANNNGGGKGNGGNGRNN